MTTTTPPKSDANMDALLSAHDALAVAMRAIELQMSELMTNKSRRDSPTTPGAHPTTPTNGFISSNLPDDMPTPKVTPKVKREVVDLCSPPGVVVEPDRSNPLTTPSVTLTPTTGRTRSSKKREHYENEQEKAPASPSTTTTTTTTSPPEPVRSAKKVMISREGYSNLPDDTTPHTTAPLSSTPTSNKIRSNEKASPIHSIFTTSVGLTRALKTMSGSRSHSHANEDGSVFGTENIILLEVKAKPYRMVVGSGASNQKPRGWDGWDVAPAGTLKLYKHKETGNTWIMHRYDRSGILKLNLKVRGNVVGMEKVLLPKKMGRPRQGFVVFFSRETLGVERYSLKVNADNLDVLFDTLVAMGAETK